MLAYFLCVIAYIVFAVVCDQMSLPVSPILLGTIRVVDCLFKTKMYPAPSKEKEHSRSAVFSSGAKFSLSLKVFWLSSCQL